jgi:hypothetical protein
MQSDMTKQNPTGGDTVPPGTFHGGDTVPPGTFH